MLKKRVYNDGSVKYFDANTNKQVKLQYAGPVKFGRLPDYVFRYISPGPTARGEGMDGVPDIPINRNAGRGPKFTLPKKKLRQKH